MAINLRVEIRTHRIHTYIHTIIYIYIYIRCAYIVNGFNIVSVEPSDSQTSLIIFIEIFEQKNWFLVFFRVKFEELMKNFDRKITHSNT